MSTWALVGSPNSGKTTLYNWLTGSRSKAVNYPGATVEYSVGELRKVLVERNDGYCSKIIDTPGIYSLRPQSEDERVTYNTLFEDVHVEKIDGVLIVADATQLNRHLVLAEQIKKTGYPVILVVTMVDILDKQKRKLNLELLKNKFEFSVVTFDGLLGKGLESIVQEMKLVEALKSVVQICKPEVLSLSRFEEKLKLAEQISNLVVTGHENQQTKLDNSYKLDRFLLHPFFGFLFFFLFMTLLFSSIYWMAQPVMELIQKAFAWASSFATEFVPGLLGEFIGSGLITAIGGVIVFVPQIFILFLGIGILEASGYLARVASLIDKPLTLIGLGGRSFVPLLSGFACAIPAIMATRNITSKKEKIIAQSIIPFMTCSARLPVYGLLIGFLYGDENPLKAGFVMSLLYFGAILVGAIASKILSIVLLKDQTKSRLLMELPPYRLPRIKTILHQAISKSKTFSMRAGPVILVLAMVLWFGTNFPRHEVVTGETQTKLSNSEIATSSYAAQVGKFMEPVFKPLGVDWRVGFGLISAFAAREVFVSSLALVFNIEGSEEEQAQGLQKAMKDATFADGTKIFTTASVVGILIFFMIALQCISTMSILKKEAGSWTPAILQLVISNGVAYVLAATAVSVLKSMGY